MGKTEPEKKEPAQPKVESETVYGFHWELMLAYKKSSAKKRGPKGANKEELSYPLEDDKEMKATDQVIAHFEDGSTWAISNLTFKDPY